MNLFNNKISNLLSLIRYLQMKFSSVRNWKYYWISLKIQYFNDNLSNSVLKLYE